MFAIAALSLVVSSGAIGSVHSGAHLVADAPVVSVPECRSCRLLRAIGQETQPPLLDAPGPNSSAPGGVAPKEQPLRTEDPHAGTIAWKEVLVGGLTLLGSDVLALGVTAVLILPLGLLGTAAVGVVFGALVLAFHALVLSPLYCALAMKWFADEPTRHGLGGALLGAYGASLIAFVVVLVALILPEAIYGPESPSRLTANSVVDVVLLILGPLMRYVGIPIAASWAMHFGSNPAPVASADSRPARWIPRIGNDGRERFPIRAPVVVAW